MDKVLCKKNSLLLKKVKEYYFTCQKKKLPKFCKKQIKNMKINYI